MNRRLILLEVLANVLAIAVAVFLHIKTHDWGLAVSIALSAEVLFHLFGFTLRYGAVLDGMREACPPEEKPHALALVKQLTASAERFRGHSIPIRLLTKRPAEWCLQDRFDEIVDQLQQDLGDLEKKRFSVEMKDVLEPSLRVCREIKRAAFCTALGKHLGIFLETGRGKLLLEANYAAALRIKAVGGGFTRLFILQSMAAVTARVHELMSDNDKNGIRVLVIMRQTVSDVLRKNSLRKDADDELDFGLWDDSYKMTITGDENSRWMHVSAADEDLEEARELKRVLEEAARPWAQFRQDMRKPINGPGSAWSSSPERILNLPPPNGPYKGDTTIMFDEAERAIPDNGAVAVLGLTHALIEQARGLLSRKKNLSIEVVDCRDYHPPSIEKGLQFRSVNWLEWRPRHSCDVIVGDDVLCNLGVWQIPDFFEVLGSALKPGGLFIVRTTAVYTPGVMHPGEQETLRRIKEMREPIMNLSNTMTDLEKQSAIYEIAWPMLHSSDFYESESCTFDLGKWDEVIHREFAHDTQFGNQLRLPYKVRVTSLDYALLKEMASRQFEILREEIPAHSIWQDDARYNVLPSAKSIAETFQQYYRTVVFSRRLD
jgi:SAM-dependent methyltransferase